MSASNLSEHLVHHERARRSDPFIARGGLLVLALAALVVLPACRDRKRARGQEHAATPQVEAYVRALQYRDAQTLYTMHLESTASGTYCSSPVFARMLQRVKQRKLDAQACSRAALLTRLDDQELDAEAALLGQLVRFGCEHPQGTCTDYAKQVFEAGLRGAPLWGKPLQGFRVQRVLGSGDEAIAYIDLSYPAPLGTVHKAVALTHTTSGWHVATPIEELLRP